MNCFGLSFGSSPKCVEPIVCKDDPAHRMTRTVREVYLKAVVARKFPEGPRGFWGLSPSVGYSFYFGLGDLFCITRRLSAVAALVG